MTHQSKKDELLQSPSVHQLTKDIIRLADDKDCVDAYYDIKLALQWAELKLNECLSQKLPTQLKQGDAHVRRIRKHSQ